MGAAGGWEVSLRQTLAALPLLLAALNCDEVWFFEGGKGLDEG